ncbi:MAG: YlmC/YmxH family sporulation protein [Clostridiales bacterium]|nr:YlmC/YmxH family sporulation protein [Clostridiales bacterium]
MNCCVTDLRAKEVVNVADGSRIGKVCDVEVDTCSGHIVAIIIFGSGCVLFNRSDDIRIPWNEIKVIGDDTILVHLDDCRCPPRRKGPFDGLFRK